MSRAEPSTTVAARLSAPSNGWEDCPARRSALDHFCHGRWQSMWVSEAGHDHHPISLRNRLGSQQKGYIDLLLLKFRMPNFFLDAHQ